MGSMGRKLAERKKRGGGPGRSASSCPLSGKSGQPDGGRLAGRVLACLYNPDRTKKVPEKMQKVTRIFVEISFRVRVLSPYATHIQPKPR
jgi:hypothetical protein